MDIETPAGTLEDGKQYDFVMAHGENERPLTGAVRIFEQEGEERYEVVIREAVETPCPTCNGSGVVGTAGIAVGFIPENVVKAEAV